jgi:transposase-like protein
VISYYTIQNVDPERKHIMQQSSEKWVTMKEAAKELGIPASTLSRLAAINAIEVRTRRSDRRSKFVNVEEVKKVLTEEI